jgi:hypothetical protein
MPPTVADHLEHTTTRPNARSPLRPAPQDVQRFGMTTAAKAARLDDATNPRHIASACLDISFARAGSSGAVMAEGDQLWPRRVRLGIRAALRSWSRPELTDDAELLTTELVTNALRHGQDDLGVRVHIAAGRLWIEVQDGSHEPAEPRNASLDDEDGRGLFIVEAIADDWGVSPDGTTTWCSLPL